MSRDSGYAPKLHHLENWIDAAVTRHRATIEFRKLSGSVRECHGDLHARNIVRWEGRLLPFDRLEFDPMLRWIETANEMAFLFMDLVGHGRQDLAFETISRYLEVCGDYGSLRLLKFYAVNRALVRAKVDAIRMHQSLDTVQRIESVAWFRARIDLALKLTECAEPVLILMHGVSGSGKSWLSERLVPALGAVRIRSDLERKRGAGMAPTDRVPGNPVAGLYAQGSTDKSYARLAARAAVGRDPSDADLSVLNRQCASLQPFSDAERFQVLDVDTRPGPRPLRWLNSYGESVRLDRGQIADELGNERLGLLCRIRLGAVAPSASVRGTETKT